MRREETVDHHIKAAWHGIARMYNQQAAKYNATMAMGFVLLTIKREGTPATKIAPLMGLETRSLTRILNSLETEGLIQRKTDRQDKRSVRILLTAKGRKMRDQAKKTVLRFNSIVQQQIEQHKLNVFFDVIKTIQQIVEKDNTKTYT